MHFPSLGGTCFYRENDIIHYQFDFGGTESFDLFFIYLMGSRKRKRFLTGLKIVFIQLTWLHFPPFMIRLSPLAASLLIPGKGGFDCTFYRLQNSPYFCAKHLCLCNVSVRKGRSSFCNWGRCISKLLRDAAFRLRPGKLLCGLKTLPTYLSKDFPSQNNIAPIFYKLLKDRSFCWFPASIFVWKQRRKHLRLWLLDLFGRREATSANTSALAA